MKGKVYSRKISSKEAHDGFIFILKNKLSFFPSLKSEFTLINDGSPQKVKVDSYPCTCRGPDKPHEHYFIDWKGLNTDDRVEIAEEDNYYILKINP